jgi:ribosomal-protein-alanine N-acetyltransferase
MKSDLRLVAILEAGEMAEPLTLPAGVASILPAMVDLYRSSGFEPPWIGYVAVSEGQAVGTCAFKCAPEGDCVEIAYFTFPEFEGRGLATAMATQLITLARTERPGIVVTAQTLPERNASNRILERLGFLQCGTAMDEDAGEVWEWRLTAPTT